MKRRKQRQVDVKVEDKKQGRTDSTEERKRGDLR
jgi:hypothetical protein